MKSWKISAGYVPPATGPPACSNSMGWSLSAYPTQIATVMSSLPPTNQASP